MKCTSCTSEINWIAQYCGSCGASTSHELALTLEQEPTPDLVEASTGAPSEGEPPSPGSHRWLALLGGLGLLAVLTLVLFQPEAGPESATGTTDPLPVTTSIPSPTSPPSPAEQAEALRAADEALTFLATRRLGAQPPGEPALGRETGLSLFVGSIDGLARLDLDRGRWTDYAITGWPVLVTGDWLVLSDTDGSINVAVPLDAPDSGVQTLLRADLAPRPDQGLVATPGPEPGQVWLLVEPAKLGGPPDPDVDVEGPRWELHDLNNNRIDRVVPTAFGALLPWLADPEVTSSAAGGVYALTPDTTTYEKVSQGTPLGVTADAVLVRTCSEPGICAVSWLDRQSWTEVDLPVPSIPIDQMIGMTPGGRILAFRHWRRGPMGFDANRGEFLPIRTTDAGPAAIGWGDKSFIASPDERYLAHALAGGYAVTDLDTGDTYNLVVAGDDNTRALFVTN